MGCLLHYSPHFHTNVFLIWGLLLKFDQVFFRVQTFQLLILHYRRWGCISIYLPLSYPFRSLVCLFVPRDFCNHSTDMVLLFNVACHRSWKYKLPIIKLTGCLSVLKELANHLTNMVLLYRMDRFISILGEGTTTLLT